MNISEIFSLLLACIFVNNYVLQHYLGFDSIYLDRKNSLKNHGRISLLLTIVLLVATTIASPLEAFVIGGKAEWARTLTYVLVVAFSVFAVSFVVKKFFPSFLNCEKVNVALNSIVLGTLLLSSSNGLGWGASYVAVIGTGVGYFLVSMVISGIGRRIDEKAIPESFRGVPIFLATLSIMSLAVYAFA